MKRGRGCLACHLHPTAVRALGRVRKRTRDLLVLFSLHLQHPAHLGLRGVQGVRELFVRGQVLGAEVENGGADCRIRVGRFQGGFRCFNFRGLQ
jgi:hypothetical protein